jgi:hypothetical protein
MGLSQPLPIIFCSLRQMQGATTILDCLLMIASAASKGMTAISADTLLATGTTRICLVLVFNQLWPSGRACIR